MKEIEILNKPNELISIISDKNITTTERRAYNTFLKFAQNKIKFENYEGNIFKIHYIDLYNKSNIRNKNMDFVEEKEIDNLMRTIVKIRDKDNKKNWKSFTLLSYVERKDNYFHFELNQFIINSLKEQTFFTTIDLLTVNSLSSQYAIIFYELAIRYEKYKIPKMSLEEVRELTGTLNEYPRFFDFRINVLEKACDEISEKTDIILSYDTEKRGRNIAFIDFKIERKKEIKCIKLKDNKIAETAEKQVLDLFDVLPLDEQIEVRKSQLLELLQNHSFEMLKSDIEYCKTQRTNDFWKYLITSCRSGHYSRAEIEKKKKAIEDMKKREEREQQEKELEEKRKAEIQKKAEEIYNNLTEEEMEKYEKRFEISLKYVANDVKEILRRRKKENIINMIIENSDILPSSM